jgi:tetratricopeptide (TPR) repeat protein
LNSVLKINYLKVFLAAMLIFSVVPMASSQENKDLENAALRNKYQNEFIELYDQKLYLQSLRPAKEIVDLTKELFGENSYRLITPLNNLGSAYYMVEEYELAQEIFRECIQLIESNSNIISPELSSPLYGIALTLNQFGQYEDAVKVLDRALRINHVNNGLYNPDQIKIHDSLTESYVGAKDVEKANHHQSFQVFISKKYYGINNLQVDESLNKLAQWYKRTGQIYSEREIHRELLNRQETRKEGVMASLVETYKNLSFSHRREGMDLFQSINPLKKAIEAINLMEAPDLNLKFEVLLDLGDTYISFGRIQSAKKAYLECWMLINEDQLMREIIEDRFSEPVRVRNVQIPKTFPLPIIGEEIGETIPGSISINYDVDTNGQTINIEVIESTPKGIIDKEASKIINRVIYRPKYIDAEPQSTEGLSTRHEYNVRLSGIEDEKSKESGSKITEEPLDDPLENPIG